MKKDLIKTNEKKKLRKVKKNWIVVAAATFAVLGTGALLQSKSVNAFADTTTVAQSSTETSTPSVTSAASDTAIQSSAASSIAGSAQSSQSSSSATASSAASATSESNSTASNDTNVEQLKWGTANAIYDKDTKTLIVNSGDNNTVGVLPQDGTSGDINFKSEVEKLVIAKPVKLSANAQWVFGNFTNLKDIEGLSNVDASDAVYMDGLFSQDKYLTSIDISNWNTSKVVSMNSMFDGTKSVQTINLTGIDTSKVQSMYAMFAHNYSLTNVIGINNLNYSSVTDMKYWFAEDRSLTKLDLSGVYAPNVTDIDFMFLNTISLTSLNMSKFSTQNVTSGKAFWFITEDPEFNFTNRNNPSAMVSRLVSFIVGPNFDTYKILFQSFGGNRKSVKIGSDGLLNQVDSNEYSLDLDNNTTYYPDSIKQEATLLWRGKLIKFIDVGTGQQVGTTLVAQGLVGQPTQVPLPDGYQLIDENGNIVNFEQSDSLDTTQVIRVGRPIRFTINLVDSDNNVVATRTVDGTLGQSFDASSLLPSGYHFTYGSTVTPSENGQTINISVDQDTLIDNHQNNNGKPDKEKPIIDNHKNNSGKSTKHSSQNNSTQYKDADKLPQTGSQSTLVAQLLGLLLIVLSLGLVSLRKFNYK